MFLYFLLAAEPLPIDPGRAAAAAQLWGSVTKGACAGRSKDLTPSICPGCL